jgi:hypothetical protein
MAVGKNGESAVSMDEAGDIKLNSDPIRRGINTILERMHQGETLDELICDISGGRFADTADFERKFIKKDTDSLDFCVAYLNYMQELSMDPDREYLPSGSVLLDFDLDYNSPIDININGERNAYVLIDTDQQVPSTVDILQAYMDGGRSLMGIGDLREPDEEEPEDEENDEETEMSDQDENPGDLEGDELEEGEEEEETAGPEPLGEQPDDSEASLYVGDESGDSAGSEYPDSWDGDSEWDSE